MRRKHLAVPAALFLALSGLGACSIGSSSLPSGLESSVSQNATGGESTSPGQSSPSNVTSDQTSTTPKKVTGKDVTSMIVSKTTNQGSNTSQYTYSGLIFTFPTDAAESSPRRNSNSWMYIVGAGKYNAIVSVSWYGDSPSQTSSQIAQSRANRVRNDGFTPTLTDAEVDGASEATMLSWTEDNEEVVKSIWPNSTTPRMVCQMLYVTGTNDFVYEASACHLDNDAEAKALADTFIDSVTVDEGYPANTPEATRKKSQG